MLGFEFYTIGYSGHAFVVIESALASGFQCKGYFEKEEKSLNPFGIPFLGVEEDKEMGQYLPLFVSIGQNKRRYEVIQRLIQSGMNGINILDPKSMISTQSEMGAFNYVSKGAVIQILTKIGNGCIINSGAVVEHECELGDGVHISPNATLCGGVGVGDRTWVGAGAVIKEGVKIGSDVVIGAGSVVLQDIPNGVKCYGVPIKL